MDEKKAYRVKLYIEATVLVDAYDEEDAKRVAQTQWTYRDGVVYNMEAEEEPWAPYTW